MEKGAEFVIKVQDFYSHGVKFEVVENK